MRQLSPKTVANLWSLWSVQFVALYGVSAKTFLQPLSFAVTVVEAHDDGAITWSPASFQSINYQTM